MEPLGPTYEQDPTAADWVLPRLTGPWGTVTGTVPAGYPSYVRLLHPASSANWSDVALELGTLVHPTVQWHRLSGASDAFDANTSRRPDLAPAHGHLVTEALAPLTRLLAEHTSTPQSCWFCTWTGYGWSSPTSRYVVHPGREYVLGRGPVTAALGNGEHPTPTWFQSQSPNLWWPEDRAWVAGTEIDFDSTLIACTNDLAAALLDDPDLETLPIDPEDSLRYDADLLN